MEVHVLSFVRHIDIRLPPALIPFIIALSILSHPVPALATIDCAVYVPPQWSEEIVIRAQNIATSIYLDAAIPGFKVGSPGAVYVVAGTKVYLMASYAKYYVYDLFIHKWIRAGAYHVGAGKILSKKIEILNASIPITILLPGAIPGPDQSAVEITNLFPNGCADLPSQQPAVTASPDAGKSECNHFSVGD